MLEPGGGGGAVIKKKYFFTILNKFKKIFTLLKQKSIFFDTRFLRLPIFADTSFYDTSQVSSKYRIENRIIVKKKQSVSMA